MYRFIVPLVVLISATQVAGQDIYAILSPGQSGDNIVRFKPDGTELTVIVTHEQILSILSTLGATSYEQITAFDVDLVNGKLYWTAQYIAGVGTTRPAIMRSNLNGSNIEIIPGIGGEEGFIFDHLRVVRTSTIPAFSTWGLIVMSLFLLTAGTMVIGRHRVRAS